MQWWYGHNAVAFFLTTPVLGIMYYFLPKAAERPVYSYRLSVVHFWSLIFVYIWAGPHHLLNTALPDWAQTLGMVFSVMLWAPSWGGMLNGLLTLRGAWDKVRTDPVLKFFAAGVTFYGMATFEGPLLSIKSVNGLAHYTDWIIGHVHAGALGWNGFMAAGMFYWMVPRLYGTKLHSTKLADAHFWIGTFGILLYVVSMWVSGITQGLMWRAVDAQGALVYPNFVETVNAIRPMYWMRLVGGTMYLVGMMMMAYNLWRTARAGKAVDGEATVVVTRVERVEPRWGEILTGKPVILVTIVAVTAASMAVVNNEASLVLAGMLVTVAILGTIALHAAADHTRPSWHRLARGPRAHVHGVRRHRRAHGRGRRARADPARHAAAGGHRGTDASVPPARARGPRHLRARRLLPLPLADDPDLHLRVQTLRRALDDGRVHLRSPVPVGVQAHRSGPRT